MSSSSCKCHPGKYKGNTSQAIKKLFSKVHWSYIDSRTVKHQVAGKYQKNAKNKLNRQLDPATSKTSAISVLPLCCPPPMKAHRLLTFKYVLVNFDKLLSRLQEIFYKGIYAFINYRSSCNILLLGHQSKECRFCRNPTLIWVPHLQTKIKN